MSENAVLHIDVQVITIIQLSYSLLGKGAGKERLKARYLQVHLGECAYLYACLWSETFCIGAISKPNTNNLHFELCIPVYLWCSV